MDYQIIVMHFGEIFLKGRNRGAFVNRLYSNVKASLEGERYDRLENARDRFILHLNKDSDIKRICEKLSHVFGITWFAPAIVSGSGLKQMREASSAFFDKSKTVRIVPRRSFKGLKYTSIDIVKEFIDNQEKLNFKIEKESENRLYITALKDYAILYSDRHNGLGGLPVGVSGKAVVLLSGGIDSPVAAFYAMKKGLVPVYLHVHAFATNGEAAASKMKEVVGLLSRYSRSSKVYFVPVHVFQSVAISVPNKYELMLFKRFLYKLAERIAKKENASVIVTGESMGQVASQTVENLIASEQRIKQLIMRPLIGFDKQEIIDMAKKIGSYELSIVDYPDVCSIRSKNPLTATRSKALEEMYKRSNMGKALSRTMKKAEPISFSQ